MNEAHKQQIDREKLAISHNLQALTQEICQEFFIDQMTPDQAAKHRTAIFKILLTHQGELVQRFIDYQREISRQMYVLECRIASLEPADDGK
jgi:hypothetical protein